MPGNAGGAKDPDFWCAFEDGKVKVIGDEPANTNYDPGPSVKAVSFGEDGSLAQGVVARHQHRGSPVVCLTVKPVGKPGAGNRHARFDERGWETGRWP